MSKNIDVHKIRDIKDLNAYLAKIDKEALNILYEDALIKIEIGNKEFYIAIDNALYSESSNILLLLTNNDIISTETIKSKLDSRRINYNEVVFNQDEYDLEQKLVIIRDKKTLVDNLTSNENNTSCTYYPNMEGTANYGYFLANQDSILKLSGVIVQNDTIYLLVNKNNLSKKEISKVLLNSSIEVNVSEDIELPDIEEEIIYEKKQ